MTIRRQDQGVDVQGDVFRRAGAIIWSALPGLGDYVPDSAFLAAAASTACGGLLGKRVLDVGSRIGLNTLMICKACPKEIIAVDVSPKMTELMRIVLLTDENIGEYLERNNGREILGDGPNGFFQTTLSYLQFQRADFQKSLFRRLGGELRILTKSAVLLGEEDCGLVDLVIGSHYLHWAVTQTTLELTSAGKGFSEALRLACLRTLEPLARVTKPGGVIALLTPDNFVTFDTDPAFNDALDFSSRANHPLFKIAHEAMAGVLKRNHSIEHKTPSKTGIFKTSEIKGLFEVGDLKLESIQFFTTAIPCDPRWPVAGYPMHLGGYDLAPDEKLTAIQEARGVYFAGLGDISKYQLVTANLVVFILRKQ